MPYAPMGNERGLGVLTAGSLCGWQAGRQGGLPQVSPGPSARGRPVTHQGDHEALGELQEVSPEQGTLGFGGALLVDALQGQQRQGARHLGLPKLTLGGFQGYWDDPG